MKKNDKSIQISPNTCAIHINEINTNTKEDLFSCQCCIILIDKKNITSASSWLVNLRHFERLKHPFLIDQSGPGWSTVFLVNQNYANILALSMHIVNFPSRGCPPLATTSVVKISKLAVGFCEQDNNKVHVF